ncbi:hypothetical protein AK812_SmicGene225 [Symbiodinium microadriaticum]|uniref:J domain-containing protein n=1 Tax=Symbiodinium microadriaticum TaxID=2951 RepID=A0A1Q9F7H9_SYMMI|nr:hypothetical protein AK812_SmicGene225 [Symbiodinium microadriaticum]
MTPAGAITGMTPRRNYYRFMSLPMDSSKEDIRLWHPDKSGEESESDRFLLDNSQREEYDFGLWKVRHHTKKRDKVQLARHWCDAVHRKDSWDDRKPSEEEEDAPRHHYNWGDRHLIEDDKVESIYWGDAGCNSSEFSTCH